VHEVEALRAKGLIQGASLENAVVLDDAGLVAGQTLRWPDEFVRHKAMDCVGDLALAGRRCARRVVGAQAESPWNRHPRSRKDEGPPARSRENSACRKRSASKRS
jgi:UDP-3-O-acyl-N-acetylglucosamine deacetylase